MNFRAFFALSMLSLLVGCAGSVGPGPGAGDNSGMMDGPCNECGTQGDIKLKISKEVAYREWNQDAYSRLDSNAVVGVFQTLKVTAKRPEKCKMCHSFSADALDFDLAHIEDSLFVKAFPKMKRELMLPGMRLPEGDSLYIDTLSRIILGSKMADGKTLDSFEPWESRDGIEQTFVREVPAKLKDVMNGVAARYGIRYASIPVVLEVEMDPKLGKSGGYTWKIVWTLWDMRYGELVFLTYSSFVAETTSRVAPEKEWSAPFAPRLWKMFSTDLGKLENH